MQQREFDNEQHGFRGVKHQAFVGTTYFDAVQTVISSESSTTAMSGSTESEQFDDAASA